MAEFSGKKEKCTCHLEPSFSVADNYTGSLAPDYEPNNTRPFVVMDAECEQLCECKERRYAEVIALALNDVHCDKCLTICPECEGQCYCEGQPK